MNLEVFEQVKNNLESNSNYPIITEVNDESARKVSIFFGSLPNHVLGLTECFQSVDKENDFCHITISEILKREQNTDEEKNQKFKRLLEFTLYHELGHAFGLGHVEGKETHIMNPMLTNNMTKNPELLYHFYEYLDSFRKLGEETGFPLISDDKNTP